MTRVRGAANGDPTKAESIAAAHFSPVPIVDDLGDGKTYAVVPGACSVGIVLRNVDSTVKRIVVR